MRPQLPALTTALLANTAVAQSDDARTTFYGGNLNGGMCSFSTYTLPSGIYGTALSGASWDNSASCGACISVTGPFGNSITAMIVDQCPECPEGGLDLFQDAFEELADVSEGIISTSWDFIDCGISEPLEVLMKEGVSEGWFSAQVVGGNGATSDLQVSIDGGSTWQSGLTRQEYNFFEQSSGFGTDAVAVKAVGAEGGEAVAVDVAVTGGNEVAADGNY